MRRPLSRLRGAQEPTGITWVIYRHFQDIGLNPMNVLCPAITWYSPYPEQLWSLSPAGRTYLCQVFYLEIHGFL